MAVTVGTGKFTYTVAPGWGKLPDGWDFGDVGGVATDKQDRVYVFNRGGHPMIVFDREGNFITSWGEGVFSRPHAVMLAPDDTLWCCDDGDHTVRQCTLDGKVLLTLRGKYATLAGDRVASRLKQLARLVGREPLIAAG